MAKVGEVVLSSGHKMPTLGYGTAGRSLPPPDLLMSIYIDAMVAGYRHFDTAASYGTEEPLGRALAAAVDRGLIKNRDEVFVTSKLYMNKTPKLGLEYVDLYLVHWPIRIKQTANNYTYKLSSEDILHFDMKQVWEAMEECSRLGLAKSIGVSNFTCAKLSKLLEHANIPPAVNQVEMNVSWRQDKLMEFCKEKNIHVCAWSPLGANGNIRGSIAVIDNPVLKEIAASKNKSVAQVALRWIHEKGASPIVKSFNKERMNQNLQIFDWELTDEEVRKIEQIPQARGFLGERFTLPEGPYRSPGELWDGEL